MLDDGLNKPEIFKNIQVTITHLQAQLASVAVGEIRSHERWFRIPGTGKMKWLLSPSVVWFPLRKAQTFLLG